MDTRTTTIYRFISEYIAIYHRPPTVRDIKAGCEISSTSIVAYHLNKLEQAGQIRREPNIARGIVLL